MTSIRIGESERALGEATPDWINQQVNRRRRDRTPICVRVHIDCPGVNVLLTTPACGGGAAGRPPNRAEGRIVQLWQDRGLNSDDFTGGNVVAFLKQLEDLVGSC